MTITQQISIDLQQPGSAPVVHAVQGEEYTREVKVTLYSGGVSWTPPSGCEVAIRYGKPDGKGGIYDKLPDNTTAWSILNNTISITLAPQMLTVAGIVNAQVEIIVNKKEILSTFHFIVDVEEDASMGAVKSENYTNWKSFWFPQTTGAKAGQYVKVTRVDSDGHVLAVSPTNEPNETNQLATNAKNTAENANSKAEQATTLAKKAQSTADSALAKANAALPAASLPNAVNDALAEAKESGVFDGKDGKDGQNGKNGSNGLSVLAVNITAGDAQKIEVYPDNVIENEGALFPRDILLGDKVLTQDGKIFIVDSWGTKFDSSIGTSITYYGATFFVDAGGVKSVNGITPDENGNVEVEIPEGSSGVYVGSDEPTDPDIQIWINPGEAVPDVNYVKSVNGITPDENGNVEIKIPESSGSSVTIDPTLTKSGAAADAKAVGDAIANLDIPSVEGLATEEYVDEAIANIDFPTGGGSDSNETWELLCDVTLEEEVNKYEFNFDNTPMKKLIVILDTLAADADTSHSPFTIVCNNDIGSGYKINQGVYPLAVPMKNAMRSVYEISAYYMADVPVLDVDTLTQKTISLGVIAHGKESTKYYVHFESLKENYTNHIMVPEIVRFNQSTYGVFAAGTRYRIYGVKA